MHMRRRRSVGLDGARRKEDVVKIDYLIPVAQDDTQNQHPHTAFEEWETLLFAQGFPTPTLEGISVGSEGWGQRLEKSQHWWVAVNRRQERTFLKLLHQHARRIFHQRWIIAWVGETVYNIGPKQQRKARE